MTIPHRFNDWWQSTARPFLIWLWANVRSLTIDALTWLWAILPLVLGLIAGWVVALAVLFWASMQEGYARGRNASH